MSTKEGCSLTLVLISLFKDYFRGFLAFQTLISLYLYFKGQTFNRKLEILAYLLTLHDDLLPPKQLKH